MSHTTQTPHSLNWCMYRVSEKYTKYGIESLKLGLSELIVLMLKERNVAKDMIFELCMIEGNEGVFMYEGNVILGVCDV